MFPGRSRQIYTVQTAFYKKTCPMVLSTCDSMVILTGTAPLLSKNYQKHINEPPDFFSARIHRVDRQLTTRRYLLNFTKVYWIRIAGCTFNCEARQYWVIARVRHFLCIQDLKKLIHTFISRRVDYCSGVLSDLPKKTTDNCGTLTPQ